MKGNEPFRPRGPPQFKGTRGPRPLMSIRAGPMHMPCPNGFRPRFGPGNRFPGPGPGDFGPPRPMMNTPPARMPPRQQRGMPRAPPRFRPAAPNMRSPMRAPMNHHQNRRPPPLLAPPPSSRPPVKRPKPIQPTVDNATPAKRVANADIDFTDDTFDIQSKLGTAF